MASADIAARMTGVRLLGLAVLLALGLGFLPSLARAQSSEAWRITAENGACTIFHYNEDDGRSTVAGAHGLAWEPGARLVFLVGGPADFKKSEGEMALRIRGAAGTQLEGVAEPNDGESFRVFDLSLGDRKDVSALVSGDLTYSYANGGAIRSFTVPLAQQLPRIRRCMAQARLQARTAPAQAAEEARSAPQETRRPAENQVMATGSGVFVNAAGQLLTNAHVVDGCRSLTSPGLGVAEVLAVDEASDLALLRFNRRPRGFVAIRPEGLKLGERVLLAGYPLRGILDNGLNFTGGNVSALAGMQGDRRFVQITAPTQPGNSGGPVLDGSGRLVALLNAGLDGIEGSRALPQNVNFAVAPFVVSAFLQENGVSFSEGRRGSLSPEAIAQQARTHTVLLQCRA